MVAYHRPIPERKQRGGAGGSAKDGLGGGLFNAWVQAEKMLQIAMMLPSAGFIGWLCGYGLDRWLGLTWIATVGAIFGIIAGLVAAVRMAMVYSAGSSSSAHEEWDESGHESDQSGKTGDSSTPQ